MAMATPMHPHKDQLIAFGQGKLVAEEQSLVEQHLEACPACCETLLDLKDDTFVELVKFAKPTSAPSGSQAPAHEVTVLVQSGEPTAPDDLPAELRNHPRYRIVELIGRGGMGNVYRAEHRLMNRPVAIKLINAQLVRNPQAVERFRREVQTAAKLCHPNIVGAFDAEQAGDAHFLVMEFVEGTDLASVVKQRGPLPVAEACDCIRQAAVGLQHAHEKGMVHRDIKPHNLMLAANGRVRILDFGLAGFVSDAAIPNASSDAGSVGHVAASHLTTLGSVMGTPDYMAPEQATDAHSADIRADIYSLGCTLYFLLTGRPPFTADNVLAKLKAHAQQPPPPLTGVTAELSKVAARMLAKQPEERFRTPAELIAALEPFTKVSRPRPIVGKLVAAAAVVFLLLLAGVIVVATDRGRLEIQSEVDDVKVVVKQGGEIVEVFDLKTGSQMRWLPGGEYELQLVGRENDVKLERRSFQMTRLGHVIVTANWNAEGSGVVRAFTAADKPITQDGVTPDDGGWRVTATETRTVRLFEVPTPQLDVGPFFFRAKLKTEDVSGQAYLEMWNRFPGKGEFFSKGFRNAVRGTTGWAEYEIPFVLKQGEQPDLVKLNVVIEGRGTVGIKDIELRGRVLAGSTPPYEPVKLAALKPLDPATLTAVERQQSQVAEAFLALMDEDRFAELYDRSSTLAQRATTKKKLSESLQGVRDTFGKCTDRKLVRVRSITSPVGLPPGQFAVVEFHSKFERRMGLLWESVVLNVDTDGQWRANTYACMLEPLPLVESKSKPAPYATVPTGKNLVTDPSLEATAIGEKYPANWGTGNISPPNAYGHRVVAGGRTGERGWQIEGEGQFAVVPSNRPPANPAYRYAASAWVRAESGGALIKLLYFDANNRYLGENVGPAVVEHGEWRRLRMIDELAKYPEARSLSLALTFTGKGKAVFDDLELLAFDARDLPKNFEAEYGAVASSTAAVFDRWVGEWETTFDVKPTAQTAEKTVRGTMTYRKALGDHFLLTHSQAEDSPPYLWFLGWDKYLAEYRLWLFGGGGEAFERRGRWESASQMLTLQLVPPSPGVTGTSTDRFIGNDRVESTLFVKAANGQVTRDSRWSARRKTPPPAELPDLPTAAGPASSPEELKLLDKLVGEWTIRATMKPSLSLPNGGEETITEKNVWVLGGRYLWSRAFNAAGENTSMWIMTYEPNEKSNRVWFFSADGVTGQWRVTWDANSRGFHWRAIDMPPGWIGSGFNRWINDNTWDNQVLIKDDSGRIVSDMTQDKRRTRQ